MNRIETLQLFTKFVQEKRPFGFTKFGDTELFCIDKKHGSGGEHLYSPEIAIKLENAYKSLIAKREVYLGEWKFNAQHVVGYLGMQHGISPNLVEYDSLLFHDNAWLDEHIKNFYKAIRESDLPKIVIMNILNQNAKEFLKADHFVAVSSRDCFSQYREIAKFIKERYTRGTIIITGCSVVAKILMAEMYDTEGFYPFQFIDLGSALDPLFIGNTRAREEDNSKLAKEFFKEML